MPEPTNPSLLLVEDDEATARALRVLFHQRANYDVFWASTVTEARELLRRQPDTVLLDLVLPDGDGEDFIQAIRDGSPASRIVVVTGLPPGCARVNRVAAMLPSSIVFKPYDVPRLIEAIRGETHSPAPATPKGTDP